MKRERQQKETRIAVRFPRSLIRKIDEAISKGFGESRSGYVRAIVARHFEEERETTSLLMRVAGTFNHPLMKVFAFHVAGRLFNAAQSVSQLGLDGQRDFFEKLLDPLSTGIAQTLNQSTGEVRKQLVRMLKEHERKEQQTIRGREFIEAMGKYAGRQTELVELAGMMHEFCGVPVEEATRFVKEWLDKTPPEKRILTLHLTPKPGSEEDARRLREALAKATQKSKRAPGKEAPGEDGIQLLVQVDTQPPEVMEVLRALDEEAEYPSNSADLVNLVEEYIAAPWSRVMDRSTAAEFLGRAIGKPADVMERSLEEIERDLGEQQIALEATSAGLDGTLRITMTCPEDRDAGWMVECEVA